MTGRTLRCLILVVCFTASLMAFDVYVHRLRAAIAATADAMGGIDVLVFTAGVGENSAEVRAAVSNGLEFLGIRLDAQVNARPTLDAVVFYG